MLINQTLDKLEALGLFGMVLGVREQLEVLMSGASIVELSTILPETIRRIHALARRAASR
jgi:hypothetical protein